VKGLPVFLILFVGSFALWAWDEPSENPFENEGDPPVAGSLNSWDEEEPPPPRRKEFKLKNRAFEIGIANLNVGFANNFIATDDFITRTALSDFFKNGDIFRDEVEIDINKFLDGFLFDFGLDIRSFFFNINVKDKWGFGLDIARIETSGNFGISGDLLGLKQAKNDRDTGAGAAVFFDTGIPIFFFIEEYKIKFRPSVFIPLAYLPPGGVSYSYQPSSTKFNDDITIKGVKIIATYDIGLYTLIPMKDYLNGAANPDPLAMGQSLLDKWEGFGYDFNLSVEYPYDETLDLGVNLTHIPFIPAKSGYRMGIKGEAWADTSKINFYELVKDDVNMDELIEGAYGYTEDFKIVYREDELKILRPFKMIAYADWRPFDDTRAVALIPSLGFAINPLYVEPGSIEGGLSIRFDLGNIFIATFGINYNDRKWKNSIDCTLLNLYIFQIDLGLVFQSQDFVESWRGAGFALNFGFKIGF
jgi:hypothetical protein